MLATSERCSHGGGTSPSTDDTNVFDLGQRLARTVVRLSALPRTPAVVATLRDAQRYKLLLADDAAADARRIRLAVSEFLRRAEEVVAATAHTDSDEPAALPVRFLLTPEQLRELARRTMARLPAKVPEGLIAALGQEPRPVEICSSPADEPLRVLALRTAHTADGSLGVLLEPASDYDRGRLLALTADLQPSAERDTRPVPAPVTERSFGRYQVIERIASGGMATVYLGRVRGAGGFERRVAIKVLHEHLADDPQFKAMFLDEARLAARIHHPNVVSTLDIQETDSAMFLVMEHIAGPSLSRLSSMRQGRGVPVAIAVRIVADALAGLHAAHELADPDGEPLHLVHRDVSPQNILVGSDGVTKITDFGVAHAEARITRTGAATVKGKLAYMAPEQALGKEIDRRVDLYAMAIVLWELLAGERLFQADCEAQVLYKMLEGVERTPAQVNPAVPGEVDAVCMRALSRDPDDRYATALELVDALEAAMRAAGLEMASAREVASFVEHAQSGQLSHPSLDEITVEVEATSDTKTSLPTARPRRRRAALALVLLVAALSGLIAGRTNSETYKLATDLLIKARAVILPDR